MESTVLDSLIGRTPSPKIEQAPGKRPFPKIVVLASTRSASQYTYSVLSHVFNIQHGGMGYVDDRNDIYFAKALHQSLLLHPILSHNHSQATYQAVEAVTKLNYFKIIQTRSIADSLASTYKLFERDGAMDKLYLRSDRLRKEYFQYPKDKKRAFLIEIATPWYCQFISSWADQYKKISDSSIYTTFSEVTVPEKMMVILARVHAYFGLDFNAEKVRKTIEFVDAGNQTRSKGAGLTGRSFFSDRELDRISEIATLYGCEGYVFDFDEWPL